MTGLAPRIIAHYSSRGVEPRAGATSAKIAAFEEQRALVLPAPVRAVYAAIDGVAGDVPEFGFHTLQFWPLAELSRVSDRVAEFRGIPDYGPILRSLPDAAQYVAFGDGAVWSHVLAFRLVPHAGPVLWICGDTVADVAPTFDHFWEQYLADPDSVLWPTQGQIIPPAG